MKSITNNSVICPFCGNECYYVYKMNDFDIWQCGKCKTGQVWPMPGIEDLKEFYDGFIPNLSIDSLTIFENAGKKLFPDLGLLPGKGLTMLDIGGGGGFFCKAFEDLGYGKSTYVDLDPQSCDFAKHELGLEKVFNCDAMELDNHINDKFDFIYTRHLIEHLLDPTSFLIKVLDYLDKDGIFVVHFPNGNSLEYLPYTKRTRKYRFSEIRKSNNYSKLQLYWVLISNRMLHGIYPPRHLWAITKGGMMRWCKHNNISCRVYSHHLGNIAYSPTWKKESNFKLNLRYFIGQKILSPLYGGTHLVAILNKRNQR